MDEESPQSPQNPPPNIPPSEGYSSFNELYDAVLAFGRNNGVGFTKRSMSKMIEINGTKQPTWGYLDCDRGYKRPSTATGIRKSRTRKTDCKYRLKITASRDDDNQYKWHYRELNSHNHEKSSNPSAHISYRRFTEPQKKQIARLSEHASIQARVVSTIIRDGASEELYFLPKDIYNQRQKARRAKLDG